MNITMKTAKDLLDKNNAIFRGYCSVISSMDGRQTKDFAVIDNLVNYKTCHVEDPAHRLEKSYVKVPKWESDVC